MGIIKCCDGMNLPEIGAMALRDVVGPVIAGLEVRVDSTARVAIETELLIVTVRTVLFRFTRDQAVAADPVRIMIWGNPLAQVTLRTFFNAHGGIVLVRLFSVWRCGNRRR